MTYSFYAVPWSVSVQHRDMFRWNNELPQLSETYEKVVISNVPKWNTGVSHVNSDSSDFIGSVPWVKPVCWGPKFNSIGFVNSRFWFWDVNFYSAPSEMNRPVYVENEFRDEI